MTTTDAQLEQARRAVREVGSIERNGEPLLLKQLDLDVLPRTANGSLEPAALAAAARSAAEALPFLLRTPGWLSDGRRRTAQPSAEAASITGSSDPIADVLAQMRAAVGLPTPPTT